MSSGPRDGRIAAPAARSRTPPAIGGNTPPPVGDPQAPTWAADLAGSRAFVSYSRANRRFVQRVHAALTERGISLWVDFEDIPPTAEWLAQLYAGIERAECFIFVISPESIGSEMCQVEVLHALKHGKRIVPVLRRPAEIGPPLEEIGKRQWVDAQDDESFEQAVATLVDAIETDPDWLEAHTRLIVRATHWESTVRSRSALLRGRELRWAEEWLERADAVGEPRATPLQYEYVRASRRVANIRRRGGIAAAALAVAVAAIALVLVGEARRRAAEERRVSESVRLAGSALDTLPRDPELGRLLGIAALERSETPQAMRALREAELRPFATAIYGRHRESVRDLATNRSGTLIATGSYDDTVRLWDLSPERAHAKAATTDTYGGELLGRHSGENVEGVAFSPDGRLLASAAADRVKLWDVGKRRRVASLLAPDAFDWQDVAFSRDGSLIAAIGQLEGPGDVAMVWSRASRRIVARLTTGHAQLLDEIAFSPDGSLVATASLDEGVRVWNVHSGKTVRQIDPAGGIEALAFSPDGRLVAIGAAEVVQIYETASGRRKLSLRGHSLPVTSLSFNRDGSLLVAGSNDDTARVWELQRRRLVAVLPGQGGNVNAVGFVRSDTPTVATASDDGRVRLWHLAPPPGVILRAGGNGVSSRLAFSPHAGRLAAGRPDGAIVIWDLAGPRRLVLRRPGGPIYALAFSRDGERLVSGDEHGTVRVWDLRRGAPLAAFRSGHGPVWRAMFMPAEPNRVLTASNEAPERSAPAELWDWRSGGKAREYGRLEGRPETALSVDASPLDPLVVTADGGTVRPVLWNANTGRGRELWGHDGPVLTAAFSSDGRRIVTASVDQTIRLWSTRTRRTLRQVRVPGVQDVAFAAGDRLIFARARTAVRIIDADDGAEVNEIRTPGAQLWDASIAGDGTRVATTGSDQVVRVYDCRACGERGADALRARVQSQVTRSLSEAERDRYLGE